MSIEGTPNEAVLAAREKKEKQVKEAVEALQRLKAELDDLNAQRSALLAKAVALSQRVDKAFLQVEGLLGAHKPA